MCGPVLGELLPGFGEVDCAFKPARCIDYLVVVSEDKYVLVPWDSATVDFERRTVTAEIAREKFRDVPTFTRDRWPDVRTRSMSKSCERIMACGRAGNVALRDETIASGPDRCCDAYERPVGRFGNGRQIRRPAGRCSRNCRGFAAPHGHAYFAACVAVSSLPGSISPVRWSAS
jgi:hypothetical protein